MHKMNINEWQHKNMGFQLVVVGALLFCGCLSAQAAPNPFGQESGYDCNAKGLSKAEMLVCSDVNLALEDYMVNQIYSQALKKNPKQKNSIIKSQREWISKVRSRCASVDCLKNVYYKREAYLGELATADGEFQVTKKLIDTTKEIKVKRSKNNLELERLLNSALSRDKNQTGDVVSCDTVWKDSAHPEDHIYGGICWMELNGKLDEYYACSNGAYFSSRRTYIRDEYSAVRYLVSSCI